MGSGRPLIEGSCAIPGFRNAALRTTRLWIRASWVLKNRGLSTRFSAVEDNARGGFAASSNDARGLLADSWAAPRVGRIPARSPAPAMIEARTRETRTDG